MLKRNAMRRSVQASIALLAGMIVLLPSRSEAQSRAWGEGYFPNLPVVTRDGKTLRFYDDLIKGKLVLFSFIFTACTNFCLITMARQAQVQLILGSRVAHDIFLDSITVEPENYTPDNLTAYADAFHAGPGWSFLTETLEDIRATNSKLGAKMRNVSEHRNELVLGNDAT